MCTLTFHRECNTDALSGVNTDDLLCDGGYMDYKQGQAAEASFGFLTRVVVKTDSATQGNCSANITIGPVRCMPAEEIPSEFQSRTVNTCHHQHYIIVLVKFSQIPQRKCMSQVFPPPYLDKKLI